MNYKVLLVTDSLGLGGRENQMALLGSNLPDDWQVLVWSLHDGFYSKHFRKHGVKCEIADRGKGITKSFKECVRRYKPSIIHYWGTNIFLATYPIARLHGIPCVNGSIRIGMLPPYLFHKVRIILASRLCPFVIANSFAGLKAAHVPPGRGYVVYNGIDLTAFPAVEKETRSSPVKVIMCANMHSSKKHILLAETAALAKARPDLPEFEFWSIGDERDLSILAEVRRIARKALESNTLKLMGRQIHPGSFMLKADIGLHLSKREGLCNSVMEEMASALPVLASDVGGMRELLIQGTGFLERSDSAEGVLGVLTELAQDERLRKETGRNGRRRMETQFSVKKMCDDTVAVYMKALKKN